MTPTDEISDPTWHDIFDRDDEIKRLRAKLDRKAEILDKMLDVQGDSMRDFMRHIDAKDALIQELRTEIAALRNRANHSASDNEGV